MFKPCVWLALMMVACELPDKSSETEPEATGPYESLPDEAAARCSEETPSLPIAGADEALDTIEMSLPIAELGLLMDFATGTAEYLVDIEAATSDACLTMSTDRSTGLTSLHADCVDIDGITLTGDLEWRQDDTGYSIRATALHLEDGDLVFTVDGEAEYEALSSDELMFDANISIVDAIGGDEVPSDRSLNVFAKSAGGVDTWYGWISVAEGLGDRTGGVCFYATVLTGVDDTCADEGDSTLTLVGADTVELVEDADTCDGCSDVTVNGESVDPYCD